MATGLWRLWLVSSVIWVTCFAIFFASEYVAIASKYIALAPTVKSKDAALAPTVKSNDPSDDISFDDLPPRPLYMSCYQTKDGKNIDFDTTKLSDSARIQISECEGRIDRFDLVKRALVTIVGVPLVVFLLGWSLLWIGQGFKPQTR
jgi:hypothetical protein